MTVCAAIHTPAGVFNERSMPSGRRGIKNARCMIHPVTEGNIYGSVYMQVLADYGKPAVYHRMTGGAICMFI
jgi:hypothetical protein